MTRLLRSLAISLLAAALLLAAGCASSAHRVRVDAINDPAAQPALRTYTLTAGSKDLDAGSLQFREAASLVRGALARQGYIEAPRAADAALTISIAYGTGQPETRVVTHSMPVYAELGGGRVQTVTKTTDAAGKTTTTTQTHTVPGRYERVGNDVTTSTRTYFPKHLTLSARAISGLSEATTEVWFVSAAYSSDNSDMRGDLPILVTALESYLGQNTGRAIVVEVRENEGRLVAAPAR